MKVTDPLVVDKYWPGYRLWVKSTDTIGMVKQRMMKHAMASDFENWPELPEYYVLKFG